MFKIGDRVRLKRDSQNVQGYNEVEEGEEAIIIKDELQTGADNLVRSKDGRLSAIDDNGLELISLPNWKEILRR